MQLHEIRAFLTLEPQGQELWQRFVVAACSLVQTKENAVREKMNGVRISHRGVREQQEYADLRAVINERIRSKKPNWDVEDFNEYDVVLLCM